MQAVKWQIQQMEVQKLNVQKMEVQEPELQGQWLEGVLGGTYVPQGGGEGQGDIAILGCEEKRSLPFHLQQTMNLFTASFTKSCTVAILGCQGDIWVAGLVYHHLG